MLVDDLEEVLARAGDEHQPTMHLSVPADDLDEAPGSTGELAEQVGRTAVLVDPAGFRISVRSDNPPVVKRRRTWIGSEGGPLVLVPVSRLGDWGGVPETYLEGDDGDYGRACDVEGLIGVLDGYILVLGDEPASTTFLPGLGVLARRIGLDSDEDLEVLVVALMETAVWQESVVWTVPGPVALFDSAETGDGAASTALRIDLEPRRYTVEAAITDELILVRLT